MYSRQWPLATICCTVIPVVACLGALAADEPVAPAEQENRSTNEALAEELVQRLGADEYRDREAAARQLLELGSAARAALQRGLKSPELEVRLQCRGLLREILHSGFEARLKAFVAGDVGATPPPGWSKFKSIVKDSTAARTLYAEMFRRDGELLAGAAKQTPAQDWLQSLRKKIDDVRAQQMDQMRMGRVNLQPETLALLLFLTNKKCLESDSQAYAAILPLYSLLLYPGAESALRDPLLLALLDDWAVHRTSGPVTYYVIEVCSRYDRKAAAMQISRKVLQDANAATNAIPLAASIIAVGGDIKDVPLLEKHLSNTARYTTHHNKQIRNEPIPIEVRDIVLALVVHMTGQKIEDYGYKYARPDSRTIYSRYSLLFLSDKEREAAFEKWKKWRAAHPKLG